MNKKKVKRPMGKKEMKKTKGGAGYKKVKPEPVLGPNCMQWSPSKR